MTRLNQLLCKSGAYKVIKTGVFCTLLIGLSVVSTGVHAQTFVPIPVTGFKQDIIADTGTNPVIVTTTIIDGQNVSDHVLYTKGFATRNSLAGGIVDNGTVVSGSRTYQFQPFDKPNAVYMSRNGAVPNSVAADTFTLITPARYSWVSLMTFSTEGASSLNIDLVFTDGTKARAVTNLQVLDWFSTATTTTPVVYSGTGRVNRLATGFSADGATTLPRYYGDDLRVNCDSQDKLLQSIIVTDTTIASNQPRAVIFAVSGTPYTPFTMQPSILPARCGSANNGTISLNVSGGATPIKYAWNTTPVQTTPTISGLSTGTYTCTITDSSGCVRTYTGNVPFVTPLPVTAHVSKTDICSNQTDTLYVDTTAAGYTPGTYTWSPGTLKGSSVVVSPGDTTVYQVYAEDIYGCTSIDNVTVNVKTAPTGTFTVNPDSVCLGTSQTITYTGTGSSSATYNWNFDHAGVQSGSGAGPYNILFNTSGLHTLGLSVIENGCTSTPVTHQTMIYGPLATPVVTVAAVTSTSITFSWQPVPGATGYIVSVNGGIYITPTSGSLGLVHSIVNLQPMETITISVIALGVESCRNSLEGKATGTTQADEVFIPNSFTPNGDGKNDMFKVYGNIIASMNMKVFNQWGQLIYETSDYTNGWDGKFKGTLQPMGVYIYAVRIKLNNGEEITRKGTVNLLH
jgi:gliding motility-associated-like protein